MECRRWFSNVSTFSLSNCPTPAGGAVKIAVDAMGGDHAPDVVVAGAVAAVRDLGAEVVLVGPQARVEREMARHRPVPSGLSVVDAPEGIRPHAPHDCVTARFGAGLHRQRGIARRLQWCR